MKELMNEIKAIPGFAHYFAMKNGKIFSNILSCRHKDIYEIHPTISKGGYARVNLYLRPGTMRSRYVHHLILETFVGLRPSGMLACHGHRGTENNCLENLYYATRFQNNGVDRERDGTVCNGERHFNAKLNGLQVRIIRHLQGQMSLSMIGSFFYVSPITIYDILKRKTWKHI